MLHGIWTNNETGIYLTCINQLPGANSENGVFKYKWPGLFPLQTLDHSINTEVLIYPNPVRKPSILCNPSRCNTTNKSIQYDRGIG